MEILRKYGVQTTIRFPLIKRNVLDLAATADYTPATGDTKISKDGGNFANTTNNPAAVGGTGSVGWTLTLTATEMQAAQIAIQIVDAATKAVEDQFILISTYGNASAEHAFDLDSAVVTPADGSITAAVIADGAIDAGAIATGAITSAKFAAGAIDAAAIATDAIDADALKADAVGEIADGVWDEAQAGHVGAGSFGKYLDTEVSGVGGGTPPTAAEVADAVWDEATAGHAGAGTAGKRLTDTGSTVDTNLDTTVSSRGTATAAAVAGVQADTDDIQSRLPAALVSGRIDASVGAMAAGVITATAIANGALTAAKAATGFFDAVLTRALGDIDDTGVSFRSLLGAARKLVNKVALSGGTLTVYKEDDATAAATQTATQTAGTDPVTALDTN